MDHLQNVMGYFDQQQPLCAEHDRISKDLYKEFGVLKRALRDENGKGVLAGLTNISDYPRLPVCGRGEKACRRSAALPRLRRERPDPRVVRQPLCL